MNDFTKEDLQVIEQALEDSLSEGTYFRPNEKVILRTKIKSMIDNYCEHISDGKQYCPGLYEKLITGQEVSENDKIRFMKCTKCGDFYK